jgi:hypothetical protein
MKERRQFTLHDDFHFFTNGGLWTKLAADASATVACEDAAKGVLVCQTDAVDNNEAAVKTTQEIFLIADDKPIIVEGVIRFVEANTDDANVAFGLADAFGADLLVDNGQGPKTSFSGALLYKVDGGTVWKCCSSIGSTQQISTSTVTAGGTAYQTARIEIQPINSTQAEVTFFIDGVQLRDSNNVPIKHTITFTGATEMNLGAYIKAGGTTNETLRVDVIDAAQIR